jgi:type I restriction enzyme S subunit
MTTTSTYAKAKLGSVCELLAGYAWNSDGFNSDGDGLPIIRIQNVANDNGKDFVYWNGSYDPRFLIELGDILLSLSGSFRAEKWSGPKALLNQRVVKLCVRPGLDENWLLTCLRQKLGQIERMGRHALVNNVSLGDLKNLEIPLPPLPEQRRIAAILDKADAIRRKREEGIRLTEELLRSTFLEMFGDPATNPKEWPVNSMNRIAKVTGGFAFKSEWFADEGDRVIRISDIGVGKVNLSDAVCVDCENYRISSAYQCVTDDILMALSGATTGKLGVVTDAESGSFVNQRIAIIRANNRAASPWLTQLLSNKRVLALLLESAGGSAQANLSTKSLESLDIPVPPDDVLFQYAEVFKSANRAQSRRRIASKDADNLFNSLVQRAFRGEL